MKYKLNDREIEIIDKDYSFGEGVQIIGATFVDNGEELTESELQEVTDYYQSELYEDAYSDACSAAYDSYKDSIKYGE